MKWIEDVEIIEMEDSTLYWIWYEDGSESIMNVKKQSNEILQNSCEQN